MPFDDEEQQTAPGSPPPAYDQVGNKPIAEPSPLVVRLQVWHSTLRGRCLAHNRRLAFMFKSHLIGPWTVWPVTSFNSDEESERDYFVPVEVEFHHSHLSYNDPDGICKTQVRGLFVESVWQPIDEFFTTLNAAPLAMNMYPVGVPDHCKRYYTHAKVLPLLQSRVQQLFRLDLNLPAFHDGFPAPSCEEPTLEEKWCETSKLLLKYHSLMKMDLLGSHLKVQRLGNQDLVNLIMDLRTAMFHFEALEKQMRILTDASIAEYGRQRKSNLLRGQGHLNLAAGVTAVVATVFWWHPVGWLALKVYGVEAAVAVQGAILGRIGSKQIGSIEQKEENVVSVLAAMKTIRNNFNQARTAATLLFLSQVLRTPLSYLGNHERKQILNDLSIGDDALNMYTEISREDLFERLGWFWTDNKRLFDCVKVMMKDGNLELTRKAAGWDLIRHI